MGKDPIKKSTTIVNILGQGSSNPGRLEIIEVTGRDSAGSVVDIRDGQTTDNKANVGDIIKYLNICMQCGPREEQGQQTDIQNNGWLEYALVCTKERDQAMASTNLGLHTLGDVATKQYRGDCIYTGCFPIGAQQANSLDLKIKLPPRMVKLQLGSTIVLYFHFRSTNTTDLRSDSHKMIASAIYKLYV